MSLLFSTSLSVLGSPYVILLKYHIKACDVEGQQKRQN
jgi:hypothetical protein